MIAHRVRNVVTATFMTTLIGLALSACGPPPQPSAPSRPKVEAPPPEPTRPPLTRRATLRYELNNRSFPLPVVHGAVAGHETWMLVDTGANSHVVAGWFARKHGMPMAKLGDVGTDHVGKSIATYRLERPNVVIDQWGPLNEGPMLVTDVPALIEKLGIGAFISPQRLTEEGDAVVLDLAAGEVRAAYYDDAMHALGAGATLVAPGARACEDTESPIKGLAFVLPGTIEGRAVDLLVDTGAQRSDILAGSAAGKALAPSSVPNKEQMFGASGRLISRTLKGAHIVVGELAIASDVDLLPGAADPFCPRDGVVSMDVLRACVLVLGRTQMYGRCRSGAK